MQYVLWSHLGRRECGVEEENERRQRAEERMGKKIPKWATGWREEGTRKKGRKREQGDTDSK